MARTLIILLQIWREKNMTFYVTSNLHEQFVVCDSFYLSHKSKRASFSATVFATQKLPNFPRLHEQIKIVTSKLSHKNCSCKRSFSLWYFETPHNPSTLQHLFITTHFYTFRSVYMHFCVNYKTSYRKTTKKKTKRIVRRSRINLLKIGADNRACNEWSLKIGLVVTMLCWW
jgi:hypothetical protein